MTRVRVIDDLDTVLATIEASDVHVVFPEPIAEHAEKLLRTLGVTWSYDPHAPRLDGSLTPTEKERRKRDLKRKRDKRYYANKRRQP